MTFDWLERYGTHFISGAFVTFWLLVISGIVGFILAILVALARLSPRIWLSGPALAFTSVIRGTPLLVQIFFIYFGIGSLLPLVPGLRSSFLWPYLRDGFWYLVFALSLSTAAYTGEIIRGALLAVPRGEIEAARAYGFSGYRLLRRIWLPRALTTITPTLAGETVLLLKATALASTVAVTDLLFAAQIVRTQTFRVYEPLLLVALGYFLMTLLIERIFRVYENRAAQMYGKAAS